MSGISKDLLLAILSMDSYNRGYGAGIEGLSDAKDTQVGPAKVIRASSSLETSDEVAAGFYAVAYEVEAGAWDGQNEKTTVISYRGTDAFLGDENIGGSDVANGYSLAGGIPGGQQDAMAIEFYKTVTQTTGLDTDPRTGNAILTGHSMGAGLAGYVAALYGKEGVLFDNMPFELAVNKAALLQLGLGETYPYHYDAQNNQIFLSGEGNNILIDAAVVGTGFLSAITTGNVLAANDNWNLIQEVA